MKLLKPSWIVHDGHPIFSIDIHPDDTHLATGGQGDDNTGRVVIWNLKAVFKDEADTSVPKLLCQLDHHNACVNCVRWSCSGHYLASGGDDKVVMIWKLLSRLSGHAVGNSAFEKNNLEIWKPVSVLRGHDGDVLDLGWSPGDLYLATCSIDNCVKIWDGQKFGIIATLEGHTSMVKGVTWDPIGKYLASQSIDKTLRIWRTSDWSLEKVVTEPFVECGGTTHVLRPGWSPDGMVLVSAHAMNDIFPTAQIIERDGWKTDKDFVGHRKAVVCVRFNNNILEKDRVKQSCVAIGSRDKSISVWSTALKRPLIVVKDVFSHSVLDITWSHCGTILMACSWDGTVLAAQFSYQDIGRPLAQDETESFLQKYYGSSPLTANKLNIVPNMEVFLARNKVFEHAELEAPQTQTLVTLPLSASSPPVKTINPPTPVKGPAAQIETRTADGKRRITPKFLPLPMEDQTNPSTSGDEPCKPTVFQNAEKKEDNLRDSMVSNIDDISFGENKVNAGKTETTVSKNGSLTENGSKPVEKPVPTPMEVDSDGVSSPVVNGICDKPQKKKIQTVLVNGSTEDSAKVPNGEPLTTKKVVVNGTGSSDDTSSNKPTPQISTVEDKEQGKKQDPVPSPNLIPVKRKRPVDEIPGKSSGPPPPKKKFNPKALGSFVKKKHEENINHAPIPEISTTPSRPPLSIKSPCSSKTRLPPLRIENSLVVQVNIKADASYSLEITNHHKRIDGLCHQIKCCHRPMSLQGLEWTMCTDAPVCAVSGDLHRIVAVCEDATMHVFDLKGRYAISPFVLAAHPNKLFQYGPHILVITVKATLHIWNIHTKSVVLKSESLLPMLNQPGNQEEKAVEVSNAYTMPGGAPVILLSNGKSFIFNSAMGAWSLYADPRGLVSSPIMPDIGDLALAVSSTKLGVRKRKPEPAVISSIKLQLIKSIELKKASSIRQWTVLLGKTLATYGLEKELHILCEDLLGPTHSSSNLSTSWASKLGDCVDKRTVLREILTSLLEDLKWQDLFCEFDEMLKEVENNSSSLSSSS